MAPRLPIRSVNAAAHSGAASRLMAALRRKDLDIGDTLAILRKIPESLLLVCYYLVTSKQNQTEFQTKKNPVYPRFFLNTQGIILSLYLFENCGALLADLRPYFLRSFILGSLVRNPAFFKVGLYSSSA